MLEVLDKPGVLIVLLIALVVFGAKRLPDSARSLGRSMRILKAEAKGLRDDDGGVAPVPPPAPLAVPPAVMAPAPVAPSPVVSAPGVSSPVAPAPPEDLPPAPPVGEQSRP